MSKDLSYKNLPISYRVFIGSIEVTDDLQSVGSIDETLDIDVISEFTINEARITLNNPESKYTSLPTNFFTRLSYHVFGYNAPITIRCGFEVNEVIQDEIVFTGRIIEVDFDVAPALYRFEVGDISNELDNKDITNFGITKYGKLEAENESRDRDTATYPFGEVLTPVSENSLSGTSGGMALEHKQELDTEGPLSPFNFNYSEDELETEGGPLSTDPIIQSKSAYRYKTIPFIIKNILTEYGITNTEIVSEKRSVKSHSFYSHGRAGYEIEGEASTNTELVEFSRHVTDYVFNSSTNKMYLLYSHRQYQTIPVIAEYDLTADTWRVVYRHTSHAEFWRIATSNFNGFFVLGTPGGRHATHPKQYSNTYYDSSFSTALPRIWKFNLQSGVFEEFISPSSSFRPQLASIVQLGQTNIGLGSGPTLPDTNKGFIIHGNYLYYIYANTSGAGIAGVRRGDSSNVQSLCSITNDNRKNFTALDFTIHEDRDIGIGYARWIESNRSKREIFSFALR